MQSPAEAVPSLQPRAPSNPEQLAKRLPSPKNNPPSAICSFPRRCPGSFDRQDYTAAASPAPQRQRITDSETQPRLHSQSTIIGGFLGQGLDRRKRTPLEKARALLLANLPSSNTTFDPTRLQQAPSQISAGRRRCRSPGRATSIRSSSVLLGSLYRLDPRARGVLWRLSSGPRMQRMEFRWVCGLLDHSAKRCCSARTIQPSHPNWGGTRSHGGLAQSALSLVPIPGSHATCCDTFDILNIMPSCFTTAPECSIEPQRRSVCRKPKLKTSRTNRDRRVVAHASDTV